jgi:hypothetical protein
MLYHPTETLSHNYEKQIFDINNQKIVTTVLNRGHKRAIIYFGGNAEIVDYNIPNFLEELNDRTIFLFNYRGYSGSSGVPTEEALYQDALEIYDQIISEYDSISLIGRSIGSGVATYLAAKRPIDKLVLVTPFDSIAKVAQELFPLYPMSLLMRDHYNSIERVGHIKAETMIIIAKDDTLVSYKRSKELADSFPPKQLTVHIIEKATHNNIAGSHLYYQYLREFL